MTQGHLRCTKTILQGQLLHQNSSYQFKDTLVTPGLWHKDTYAAPRQYYKDNTRTVATSSKTLSLHQNYYTRTLLLHQDNNTRTTPLHQNNTRTPRYTRTVPRPPKLHQDNNTGTHSLHKCNNTRITPLHPDNNRKTPRYTSAIIQEHSRYTRTIQGHFRYPMTMIQGRPRCAWTVPNQKLSPTSCIIIAGYPRLCTDIAENSAITIIAGDHGWLYIIMQDKKRITYAQLWSKHYTILIDDTATIIC